MSAHLTPRIVSLVACAAVLAPVLHSGARRAAPERWLLVSDEPGNRLVMLSVATGRVVATIPVGGRPRGMATGRDTRRVFVALGNDDAVAVVDVTSRHVVRRLAVGKDPEQVAVSPDAATVYVSNEIGRAHV